MHAPLLVAAPMMPGVMAGTRVAALTEFIDIYPSLCELSGLPIPAHVQGQSFVSLMKDPTRPGKPFAIGRFGNGDTIRTEYLRFSEYTDRNQNVTGNMLYDHRIDAGEDTNIATAREADVKRLEQLLRMNKGQPTQPARDDLESPFKPVN